MNPDNVAARAFSEVADEPNPDLRERIMDVAYPMFASRGIRDVSVEEIQRAAGIDAVTRATVYATRDDIAADFLARREREWTIGTIEAGARQRGADAEGRLLAIFDVFDDWFHRTDYEACSFVNVLLEMGAGHPLGRASIEYLQHIRQIVTGLAGEAGLRDPEVFAMSWHVLMKGSIIAAAEGDTSAAQRAKAMGRSLIREFAPVLRGVAATPEQVAPEGESFEDWIELVGVVNSTPVPVENAPRDRDYLDLEYGYQLD